MKIFHDLNEKCHVLTGKGTAFELTTTSENHPCLPAGSLPLRPPGQAPPHRGIRPGGRPYGPAAKEG